MYILRRRELGHGLGSFRDCVLGEFTWEHETNCRLDFARTQRGFLVIRGEFSRFRGDAFENIVNERIHDAHSLFGNAGIGMDLLQHFVNVRGVRFRAFLVLGLAGSGGFGWSGFARTALGRSLGHVGYRRWGMEMEF
jgi:hypothetical protein